MRRTKGSVLVGLLWCLALLGMVVIGVLHTSRLDLMVVKNYGDRIQAHYLALAGIEKAKALLYQDAMERRRSARNHSEELYDAPQQFRDVTFGRGQFRVYRIGRADEGGGVIYGVSDEESRLNLNTASSQELAKLEGMTPDVLAAIQDWRDTDNTVSPGGAEAEYYSSLRPPSQARNGPFQTVRELLMVRGVSRELLLGRGAGSSLPPGGRGGRGGADSMMPEGPDGIPDQGWSEYLTVDSLSDNLSASGEERVNVQSADQTALTGVHGITTDVASAIVASRGQNRLETLDDLLDVAAPAPAQPGGGRGNAPSGRGNTAPPQNLGASTSSGAKVISEDLLRDIGNEVTTQSDQQQQGLVNVNTAGKEVLMCLPGMDAELAQAIISYRKSSGYFANIGWLLKVPRLTRQVLKQIAPRVTVRSETYRILSEGKVKSTGTTQRIQMIVHIGKSDIQTLSYREDL